MLQPQLSVFVCVADCGSFAKADAKLFLSPAAVMKQMNQLERQWGLALLMRTHHGVCLTAAGESLYRDAKFMLTYAERAIERARKLAEAECCTICVGTSMLNPCGAFMDLWYRISEHFPQFKIHIVPFEDNHAGILSVIASLGEKFDFLVAACDSAQWLAHCNFYPLCADELHPLELGMLAGHPPISGEHPNCMGEHHPLWAALCAGCARGYLAVYRGNQDPINI